MANPSKPLTKILNADLAAYGAVSEFCRNTGFSRSGVEKWLRDEANPSLESLPIIAQALGRTVAELVGETEATERPNKNALRELLEILPTLDDDELGQLLGNARAIKTGLPPEASATKRRRS